jgi:hypothetical protein
MSSPTHAWCVAAINFAPGVTVAGIKTDFEAVVDHVLAVGLRCKDGVLTADVFFQRRGSPKEAVQHFHLSEVY